MATMAEADVRRQYQDKVASYTAQVDSMLAWEKRLLGPAEDGEQEETGNAGVPKEWTLAEGMLNLCSHYFVINGIFQSFYHNKYESALNDARKTLYRGVTYLESLVTGKVDAPFSEYEEHLETIKAISSSARYDMARKFGLAIELLEEYYGDSTRWKWTFVELEGRYIAAAKNLLDLKNLTLNMQHTSPNYRPTVYHVRLCKKLLLSAARRYRERYESGKGFITDFHQSLNFLNALKRIHHLLGETTEIETIKKMIDAWSTKLDLDEKKQNELKRNEKKGIEPGGV